MPPSKGDKKVASVWKCALCRVQVVVAGRPKRLKHALCGKWLDFMREIAPAPASSRPDWPYPPQC
jgi:hypothetical protein